MNTQRVFTPILVAILVLGVFSAIGLKGQTAHASSVSIATSADSHGDKFFGEGMLQVVVTDPNKSDSNTRESTSVTIRADPNSGGSGSKTFTIPETSKSSGQFEFYLEQQSSSSVNNTDIDAMNNKGVGGYTGSVDDNSPAPVIKFGPSGDLVVPGSKPFAFTHFTISAGDAQITVDYDTSQASISLDRTTYGSDNKMHIFMTDQDANLNPTAAETLSFNQTQVNNLFDITGASFDGPVTFKETGTNTAMFEGIVTLANPGTNSTDELAWDTKGIQMTLHDQEDYRHPGSESAYNANTTSTADVSFTINDNDGTINDLGAVSFGTELPVTVMDNDRNLDSQTIDRIPGALVVSTKSGSDNVTVDLKETGENTGIFVPDLPNGEVKVTFGNPVPGDSLLQVPKGETSDDIMINYTDPKNHASTAQSFIKRVDLDLGSPSVDLPKTSGVNDDVKLQITEPNLNDNSRTRDAYTFTLNGNGPEYALMRGSTSLQDFATIEVNMRGSNPTFHDSLTYTLVETDVNSGVFTTTLHMDDILKSTRMTGDINDGDQFRVTLHDYFGKQSREVSDSLAIGKPSTGVDFSRTVLPVPPAGDSSEATKIGSTSMTTIIVTDGDQNQNSNTEDQIPWNWIGTGSNAKGPAFEVKLSGSGVSEDIKTHGQFTGSKLESILPSLEDITLKETGKATGVFSEQLPFVFGDLSANNWQDLKVTIVYFDSNGNDESNGITFRNNDGVVSANVDSVSAGTQITITVQDQDLNLDDNTAEEFSSSADQTGKWLVSVETQDDKIKNVPSREFRETGPDTGIFTATFTVGDDIATTEQQSNGNIKQATNIHIEYNDEVDSSGNAGDAQELDLPVVTSTGAVMVSPDIVGPGTDLKVLVSDSDLNKDSNGADTYADAKFVTFTSDRKEVGSAHPKLVETGPNTGVFSFNIQLVTDKTACKDDDLSASKFKAVGGSNPTMGSCPGDMISVKYDDAQSADGHKTTVSKVVEVKSFDPEFKVDKDSYNIGDRVTVTISDPDANRDPDVADSLKDVKVYSTTDPVGLTLSGLETGKDTGVFKLSFTTSSTAQSGSLQVKQGDDVIVKYTDDFPANFIDSQKKKDFTYNVPMGGNGSTSTTVPTAPSVKDITGKAVNEISAGQQVVLSTQIHNSNSGTQPFVAIVEVRDSSGVTVFLAWQTGTLNPSGQTEVGLSWTPDHSGQYTVRTFVLSSLSTPTILSEVKQSNISVS